MTWITVGHGDDKACLSLRRLTCGLPSSARDRLHSLMLQVYIDESGRGVEPVFVLAGYIGRVRNWESFSVEWQKLLSKSPKLTFLHMNEAQGLKDAFRGWTTIQRDKRLMEMAKLINRYAMLAMDLTIDISAFNRILKRPKILFKNPYAVAFAHIPTWVLASGSQRKTIEKIELIFDRGVLSRDDAIRDSYIGMMTHLPPNLTALLHGRPRFEDDKEVLPLQAADLWAWHVRRQHFEAMNGNRWESPVWSELTKINTRTIHLGERELTEYRDRLLSSA